ncbi:MAG: HDIG domain-containing protein [Candidatus Omnitrophota bacterium]|nr:HDIG domain-containing protein [Candidatus Omnitrophota bacterium]
MINFLKNKILQTKIRGLRLKFLFLCPLIFLFSRIIHANLIIPAFLLSLWLYLQFRKQDLKNFNLLYLSLLFLITFTSSYFFVEQEIPLFYLPFATLPMLLTLLFNNIEISLIVTLGTAVSIASLLDSPFQLNIAMLYLISGTVSSILVKEARKRSSIIKAGLLVGATQIISLILADNLWIGLSTRYLLLISNGFVSAILVLGILPIFEYLFKTITNISLLELADFSHPLLKRLTIEAPGTYHHSLIVGNLSESASNAIYANGLLARIGGYYHDIGKLIRPEYFGENQSVNENKHDALPPTMSKLIIMSHVKEGTDLAKKYRLNPLLIDFIEQHHGKSLIYFFYRRALETSGEEKEVKEEVFRYPGPLPKTKETAIVLLADSVEAAVRALKEEDPSKIKEEVHRIINDKFVDGQLNKCNLTLNDLEKISEVFVKILTGIYHSRISYLKSDNHNKSSREDSRLPKKDKESSL